MQSAAFDFYCDESGAAGVDWVVMIAGVVAALFAAFAVVSDGAGNLTNDVGAQLAEVNVGTPPGNLPWAGAQSGTAAAEAGGAGNIGGGASGLDGEFGTGLGTGSGGTETADGGPDGETVDVSELEELLAELDPEILVVDPAAAVDEVVTDLIQQAVDEASATIQILAQREVWVDRIGNASYPQAADVVAAFDAALISNGIAPPV